MSTLHVHTDTLTPPEAKDQSLCSGKCGMLCLICSEITFFGTLLAVYLFYIGKDPVGTPTPTEVLDVSAAPMKVLFNSFFACSSHSVAIIRRYSGSPSLCLACVKPANAVCRIAPYMFTLP